MEKVDSLVKRSNFFFVSHWKVSLVAICCAILEILSTLEVIKIDSDIDTLLKFSLIIISFLAFLDVIKLIDKYIK